MPIVAGPFDALCECMFTEQEDGSSRCNACRGDIYACECPLNHAVSCPENPSAPSTESAQ